MQPSQEVPKEYTEDDFKREQETFLKTCNPDMREGYEKNYLARLNNFPAFLPVKGAPYRRMLGMVPNSTEPSILKAKEVIAAIDQYLAEQNINVTEMTAEEVKEKMPETVVALFIELRRQGFGREELTK